MLTALLLGNYLKIVGQLILKKNFRLPILLRNLYTATLFQASLSDHLGFTNHILLILVSTNRIFFPQFSLIFLIALLNMKGVALLIGC